MEMAQRIGATAVSVKLVNKFHLLVVACFHGASATRKPPETHIRFGRTVTLVIHPRDATNQMGSVAQTEYLEEVPT